eukprot:TRINITY_DN2582_c0_g1_i18.p1 TRINITY_DN2582_c0_g1~~TRINITY_DN2582_c0_g1_i18.p1  ORF type:complete len:599 (+),score=120.43 TRINITY_DN2582_c0_g1_i18:108-1904(+)
MTRGSQNNMLATVKQMLVHANSFDPSVIQEKLQSLESKTMRMSLNTLIESDVLASFLHEITLSTGNLAPSIATDSDFIYLFSPHMGLQKLGSGSPASGTAPGRIYLQNKKFHNDHPGSIAVIGSLLFFRSPDLTPENPYLIVSTETLTPLDPQPEVPSHLQDEILGLLERPGRASLEQNASQDQVELAGHRSRVFSEGRFLHLLTYSTPTDEQDTLSTCMVHTYDPLSDFATVGSPVQLVTSQMPQTINPDHVVFAVNCGGPAFTSADGFQYEADTNFSRSSVYTAPSTSGIYSKNQLTDNFVYRTARVGIQGAETDFSYTVPSLQPGRYLVTLKFYEIELTTSTTVREFSVLANDQKVVSSLNLFKAKGNSDFTAQFVVQLDSDTLDLQFAATSSTPIVNAIVVSHADALSTSPIDQSYELAFSTAPVFTNGHSVSLVLKATDVPDLGGSLSFTTDPENICLTFDLESGIMTSAHLIDAFDGATCYDHVNNAVWSFDINTNTMKQYANAGLPRHLLFPNTDQEAYRSQMTPEYILGTEVADSSPAIRILAHLDRLSRPYGPMPGRPTTPDKPHDKSFAGQKDMQSVARNLGYELSTR